MSTATRGGRLYARRRFELNTEISMLTCWQCQHALTAMKRTCLFFHSRLEHVDKKTSDGQQIQLSFHDSHSGPKTATCVQIILFNFVQKKQKTKKGCTLSYLSQWPSSSPLRWTVIYFAYEKYMMARTAQEEEPKNIPVFCVFWIKKSNWISSLPAAHLAEREPCIRSESVPQQLRSDSSLVPLLPVISLSLSSASPVSLQLSLSNKAEKKKKSNWNLTSAKISFKLPKVLKVFGYNQKWWTYWKLSWWWVKWKGRKMITILPTRNMNPIDVKTFHLKPQRRTLCSWHTNHGCLLL